MNEASIALLALLGLCLVVMIAPRILKMNKGQILSKVAMWLAIFLALGLAYSLFGPGSKHPVISQPAGMQRTLPEGQPGSALPMPPPMPMPPPPALPPAAEPAPQVPAPEAASPTTPMPEETK